MKYNSEIEFIDLPAVEGWKPESNISNILAVILAIVCVGLLALIFSVI